MIVWVGKISPLQIKLVSFVYIFLEKIALGFFYVYFSRIALCFLLLALQGYS